MRMISTIYTVSQKKTELYLFENNFVIDCPILIILSLLQTEINCKLNPTFLRRLN